MTMGCTSCGLLVLGAACLLLYLASPHQALRAAPLPASARRLGWLLLAAGQALLLAGMQPVAAWLCGPTWAMLLLVLLPYAGALKHHLARRRGGAA